MTAWMLEQQQEDQKVTQNQPFTQILASKNGERPTQTIFPV
ncbi:MAG: hypothetical protein AAGK28_16840 [Pseudomonadota bacterium]